ncbi:MAG: NADH-quinone oxidoreductase subunit N, partial [Parasphingorhabdus sp.]
MTPESVQYLPVLPEIIVALMGCLILIIDLYLPKDDKRISYYLTLATLLTALGVVVNGYGDFAGLIFNHAVIDDALADVVKAGVLAAAFCLIVYSRNYAQDRQLLKGEFLVLVLFAVVGMMVLASASHLLSLYMGLELLSLCLYALIAMQRDSGQASESAMKYFVLGALASGILLYGMSILYGLTGTLQIATMAEAISVMDDRSLPLILGLIFVVVGLGFKLGAVPFHMWVPDVYQGSPTCATILIGSAPKLAAFAMVARLLVDGLGDLHQHWSGMLAVLAILSVGVGNTLAIAQTNIKRMLAYSTISHMGFFLFGILSGALAGYGASLFYVLVYTLMSVGAFGILMILSRKDFECENIDDLKGLNQTHPWLAFLMMLLMFSMAGVPPTVG